jgi:hypothetical protein
VALHPSAKNHASANAGSRDDGAWWQSASSPASSWGIEHDREKRSGTEKKRSTSERTACTAGAAHEGRPAYSNEEKSGMRMRCFSDQTDAAKMMDGMG